jgi:tyrosine decarboxylase/aspartate 1-decarboxylase
VRSPRTGPDAAEPGGAAPGHLGRAEIDILREALEALEAGFAALPSFEGTADASPDELRRVILETAHRLRDNYPYFHPLYAGQMLAPPHPVARIAYSLSLGLNPNNHAIDGGRASSAMEKEAVAALARMVEWDAHLGHLTSGGTMANLEALWVSGRLRPGEVVAASEEAHTTHARIGAVLGLDFEAVPCSPAGRMDVEALARLADRRPLGTVVATLGTTARGAIDPLPEILDLARSRGFRVHVDAAYGGYFALAGNLDAESNRTFERLREADSIVIDPHKRGLQPYGCGCILFRDPSVGVLYKHDSPYTYFSSTELHLGEITLECSRPGAAAVALWATQKLLPLERGSAFARRLEDSRSAALVLQTWLERDPRFLVAGRPALDIVVWAPRARRASEVSLLSRKIFEEAARLGLHLALVELSADALDPTAALLERDRPRVTCLRSVLMKPEHLAWVDRMTVLLDAATRATLGPGHEDLARA